MNLMLILKSINSIEVWKMLIFCTFSKFVKSNSQILHHRQMQTSPISVVSEACKIFRGTFYLPFPLFINLLTVAWFLIRNTLDYRRNYHMAYYQLLGGRIPQRSHRTLDQVVKTLRYTPTDLPSATEIISIQIAPRQCSQFSRVHCKSMGQHMCPCGWKN